MENYLMPLEPTMVSPQRRVVELQVLGLPRYGVMIRLKFPIQFPRTRHTGNVSLLNLFDEIYDTPEIFGTIRRRTSLADPVTAMAVALVKQGENLISEANPNDVQSDMASSSPWTTCT